MLRTRRPLHVPSLLALSLLAASGLGCTAQVDPATPQEPSMPQAVQVAVSPSQVAVAPSAEVAFQATVTGSADTSVVWSVLEAAGGTVSAAGLYTAPPSAGTFHVVATSGADPTKQGSAAVTVSAPAPVAVTVSPATGSVKACQTLQLAATVTGATNTAVTWAVQEGAAGGTVSASGLYTAPAGPGTYHAVATSVADGTKSAVATITVTESIIAVAVSPQTITVPPGGSAQFTATVTNTCGTFTSTGTVFANGTVIAN